MRISSIPIVLILAACSPVMEATRPDPIDLQQFVSGEDRLKIIGQIGTPLAKESKNSDEDDKADCEVYKLYTKGPGAAGKGAISAGEAVADVLTLGLAEVAFTPAEAATRNTKHTVIFCYDKDDRLISVTQSDAATGD